MKAGNITSQEARSHLLTFPEFCVMYLYVWSPTLWPGKLPTAKLGPSTPGGSLVVLTGRATHVP